MRLTFLAIATTAIAAASSPPIAALQHRPPTVSYDAFECSCGGGYRRLPPTVAE